MMVEAKVKRMLSKKNPAEDTAIQKAADEERWREDAILFMWLVDRELVRPLVYNENLATMLYEPTGKPFSINQWRQICREYNAHPKKPQ